MNVVFCSDGHMADCLLVAVASIMQNTASKVQMIVLEYGIEPNNKRRIVNVFTRFQKHAESRIEFRPVQLDRFDGFSSLHGNRMTYARLLLPEILEDTNRVIYLDCDLIVLDDLEELWEYPLAGRPVGGVSHTFKSNSIEQEIWNRYEISLDSPYFNAGVLLINLHLWRERSATTRFVEALHAISGLPKVVDQTALNLVFNNEWEQLDYRWNFPAWCGDELCRKGDERILHYIGSPKPWDLGGRFLNPGSDEFFAVADSLGEEFDAVRRQIGRKARLQRSWRIRRPYAGALRKKVRRYFT